MHYRHLPRWLEHSFSEFALSWRYVLILSVWGLHVISTFRNYCTNYNTCWFRPLWVKMDKREACPTEGLNVLLSFKFLIKRHYMLCSRNSKYGPPNLVAILTTSGFCELNIHKCGWVDVCNRNWLVILAERHARKSIVAGHKIYKNISGKNWIFSSNAVWKKCYLPPFDDMCIILGVTLSLCCCLIRCNGLLRFLLLFINIIAEI